MFQQADLRIISHPLCPFAQRIRLLLLRKGMFPGNGFSTRDVDLADIPNWFTALSPQGRMPVVTLDGEVLSFETNNVLELIDELLVPRLHPAEPLERLKHRDAIAQADRALDALKRLFLAKDEERLLAALAALFASLEPLEAQLAEDAEYFDGERLSLVDVAFAPLFSLTLFYPWLCWHPGWKQLPRVHHYGRALVERDDVARSCFPDYHGEFLRFFALNDSAFATHAQMEIRHAI